MVNTSEIPEGTVTVLFTDLVESTRLNQQLGDEQAREISRSIEEMARRLVEAHKGILIKEMGDGLMAVFPSARRAITAGREIQAEMRRKHRAGLDGAVAMRIGLHTGEVIAEDGDVHGETVIIAKRIEGLAPPGGVLASETVHGVLGTARDELVDHGEHELKGIDAPWRLYLVPPVEDEEEAAEAAETAYVGRVSERAQLDSLVASAASGHGAMVLIGGAAGLGKSRITREALASARRLGMMTLVGHCLDMVSPPPYQPHIDQIEQATRETSPERLRAALGENAAEVAHLMPSLRQRYDDIPLPPVLAPEQERRYMLHGVSQFIERAAGNQALVLVFEDLHWADESTLLLLRHIGPRLAEVPLLIIGTYRDDELDSDRPLTAAIGPLRRDVGAVDIRLRNLGGEEIADLLAARAGKRPPPELVDLVVDETQGNPYFAEELYRHLNEGGKLFAEGGGWRSGFEIGETEVPQGVRLILERRLDQLAADHRKLLATAAVIGRLFSFELLAAASGADEDDLFDMIEAAERLHLIEEATADRDARYVFVQEQIRQTLLGELSMPRRNRMHLRIADALDAAPTAAPIDLAHHLFQAGAQAPADRAAAALLDAASLAMSSLAFEDALRHLERAEPLIEPGRRHALVAERARALRGGGHVDEALAVLDDELAASASDGTDRAPLRLQRIQLLLDQYRASEALPDVTALVAEVEAGGHADIGLDVRLALGRTHYILSLDDPDHAERSREAYEQSYAAAVAAGDRRRMALSLLPTTWFTDYWVDYRPTATKNVEEALRLASELGDVDLLLDARIASMHALNAGRDLAEAERLLADLEARHDPVRLNAHCFWLMWRYFAAGELQRCVDMCDRGIELAALIGTKPVQYGGIKSLALTEMGRWDEVQGALDQEVTDDDHPFGQAMASFGRSIHLVRIGAWQPAAESLVDTIDRATAVTRVWMTAWAASALAVVSARLGAVGAGNAAELRTLADAHGSWDVGATGGEIALIEGRFDDAVALVQRIVDRAPDRQQVAVVDVASQARLALGEADAALDLADAGLASAVAMGAGAVEWSLRRTRAAALAALGRDADAIEERARTERVVEQLAGRIGDPALQDSFRSFAATPF